MQRLSLYAHMNIINVSCYTVPVDSLYLGHVSINQMDMPTLTHLQKQMQDITILGISAMSVNFVCFFACET